MRLTDGKEHGQIKLVYFAENLFTTQKGVHYHEYGWYFWVNTDRRICGLKEVIPNPDHPDLIIRYLALDVESLSNFWPPFLARYLPADRAQGFAQNPRHVFCRQSPTSGIEVRELEGLFPRPA